MSFQSGPVVICIQKHIHTKYVYYSLLCWPPSSFWVLTPGMFLEVVSVTTDDARCSHLSWANTRVLLISCSTHSSKLSPRLLSPHIDCEEQRKGCMPKMNRIFEQTPPPHIYLKVQKGEAYFRKLMVHLHAIINTSHRVCWWQLTYTHTHK